MGKAPDLTGQRFGELEVISRSGSDKHRRSLWNCHCDCGADVVVPGSQLRGGQSKSCGHRQRTFFVKNGYCENRHGMSKTRLYDEWSSMKYRCHTESSKDYPDYGERGIYVCDEWRNSFESFRDWALANGYQDDLSIDRKDNDGPYCPENCRWATIKQQAYNKRTTVYITYNGVTRTVAEWAAITGIKSRTIAARLRKGWSPERALTEPLRESNRWGG